jgi:hypothetical protein
LRKKAPRRCERLRARRVESVGVLATHGPIFEEHE